MLEVAPNRYLAESNAILWYVAGGTTPGADERIERAEALQWMFFEQHSVIPNIGAAYFWLALIKGGRDLQSHALEDWMENGYRALGVMEMHLAKQDYFVDGRFTIADIALYAYTHVAHECDFDLGRYPAGARLARPRRRRTRPRRDGLAARTACGREVGFSFCEARDAREPLTFVNPDVTKTPRFLNGDAAIAPNQRQLRALTMTNRRSNFRSHGPLFWQAVMHTPLEGSGFTAPPEHSSARNGVPSRSPL